MKRETQNNLGDAAGVRGERLALIASQAYFKIGKNCPHEQKIIIEKLPAFY